MGVGREVLRAGEQHVTERRREVVTLDPAGAHGAEQLLDEQRDPLRTFEHELDELAVGALAEDRLDLSRHGRGVEALKLEPLSQPLLFPARRHPPERVRAMQLVRADGEHHQQPLRPAGDEEADEVQRRPVGPLHVLEHDHQRTLVRQPVDHAQDELQHPRGIALARRPAAGAVVELGDEPPDLGPSGPQEVIELVVGEVPGQRPQHLHHGATGSRLRPARRSPPTTIGRPARRLRR